MATIEQNISYELGEDLTIEDLECASDFYEQVTSGRFYQIQAEAQVSMWGSCNASTAKLANEERVSSGLQPVEYPNKSARYN